MKRSYIVVVPVLLFSSLCVYASTRRKAELKDFDPNKLPEHKTKKIPNLNNLLDQL
ncbi:hypothetical protein VISP3789_06310 [Vibrio splendidus ATCC 33789]|nr:hypothetical protein VISP3789_06310 [Vibrio splendidus ATCC 33789]